MMYALLKLYGPKEPRTKYKNLKFFAKKILLYIFHLSLYIELSVFGSPSNYEIFDIDNDQWQI